MRREVDDGIAEDYRNEQAYHDSHSRPPPDREGLVARYWKGQDCPDALTCDVVYIDRLTGREVMRYDGADPANTRFDYGAPTDTDSFSVRGMDINEMVDPDDCVVTAQECALRMRYSYDNYSVDFGEYEDYDVDYEDYDDGD